MDYFSFFLELGSFILLLGWVAKRILESHQRKQIKKKEDILEKFIAKLDKST